MRGAIALIRPRPRPLMVVIGVVLLATTVMLTISAGEDELSGARQLEVMGDYEAAAQVYRTYLEKDPGSMEALRGLAVDLAIMGRFDEALPFQEQVCRADSSDAQTRVELALNYVNHQHRVDEAVPLLRQAISLDPSSRNRAVFGQVLLVSGNVSAGEKELRSLIAKTPSYGYAYSVLIRYLEKYGRDREAKTLRATAAARGLSLG